MRREEAIAIYPDDFMGFQAEFVEYQNESEVVTVDDKGLVSYSVCVGIKNAVIDIQKMGHILNSINENDNQNQKEE